MRPQPNPTPPFNTMCDRERDAVNAIERKYAGYAVEVAAAPGASAEAAAAAAAHGILERLFPQQKATIDAALARSLKEIADGPGKDEGPPRRARGGREAVRPAQGRRRRRPSSLRIRQGRRCLSGDAAYEHEAHPATLGECQAVRACACQEIPDGRSAPAGQRGLCEGSRRGQADGLQDRHRAHQREAIAIHWAGSEVPPFNAVARAVSAARKLNLVDNARFFALLTMAMADSLIAGFDNKYRFNFWRPLTAIRNAGDPNWGPLIVTPPHPDYPSGHCLGAGAAVAVLQAINGSDTFSAGYIYPPLGVQRQWQSFSQIAKEVEDARVWGGIHFRSADEHGTQLGRQVAQFALKTRLLSKTH